jgi:hypothetical protein
MAQPGDQCLKLAGLYPPTPREFVEIGCDFRKQPLSRRQGVDRCVRFSGDTEEKRKHVDDKAHKARPPAGKETLTKQRVENE